MLAERYRLEDLISESNDAFIWRAADQTLNRSVCIQAMAASDTRVEAFLEAARRSTAVTDPRFLRILDIVEDERGQTYLVREWARAVSLDRLLRQSPFPNRRAATVVSEIAEAMGNAHEVGIYHLHLCPGAILIKESGAVRITGLAVDQALHSGGVPARHVGQEEQVDVEAIGKLLYVCLARRWPGERRDGLKGAPTEHGRLLRPRQVRAGVSRDVDTVCDRILGTPPRHGEQTLRAARDIAHALRLAGDDESLVTDDQPSLIGSSPNLFNSDVDLLPMGPPPAIHPPKRKPAVLQPKPPTAFQRSRTAALQATKGDRKWIAGGMALLLLVAVSIGVVLGRQSDDQGSADAAPPTSELSDGTAFQPLQINDVSDFDPWGDDLSENPEQVGYAYDQKLRTAWTTLSYESPDLGNLKPGVGLLVDLGKVRSVASVDALISNGPADVSVYTAGPNVSTAPTQLSELNRAGGFPGVRGDRQLPLSDSTDTRWVLIWLTKLPRQADGNYRGSISELTVRGTP